MLEQPKKGLFLAEPGRWKFFAESSGSWCTHPPVVAHMGVRIWWVISMRLRRKRLAVPSDVISVCWSFHDRCHEFFKRLALFSLVLPSGSLRRMILVNPD